MATGDIREIIVRIKDQTTQGLKNINAQADKLKSSLSGIGSKKFGSGLKASLVEGGNSFSNFRQRVISGFSAIGQRARGIGSSITAGFQRAGDGISALFSKLKGPMLAAGAAAAAVGGSIVKAASKVDDLTERSEDLGISYRQLQKILAQEVVLGIDPGTTEPLLKKLSAAMGELKTTGKITGEFENLDKEVVELLKNSDNVAEAFDSIMESLSGMDRMKRASVFKDIFGRAGTGDVTRFGNYGEAQKQAVDKLMASTREVPKAQQEAASDLDDSLSRTKASFGSLFEAVFLGGAGGASKVLDRVTESVNSLRVSIDSSGGVIAYLRDLSGGITKLSEQQAEVNTASVTLGLFGKVLNDLGGFLEQAVKGWGALITVFNSPIKTDALIGEGGVIGALGLFVKSLRVVYDELKGVVSTIVNTIDQLYNAFTGRSIDMSKVTGPLKQTFLGKAAGAVGDFVTPKGGVKGVPSFASAQGMSASANLNKFNVSNGMGGSRSFASVGEQIGNAAVAKINKANIASALGSKRTAAGLQLGRYMPTEE